MATATLKKKRKKKKLTTDELKQKRAQASHKKMVRSVFRLSGFARFPKLADKEFTFKGQTSDFDDIYLYENVLVCIEYTISQTSSISSHIKPKKIVYDKVQKNVAEFSDFLSGLNDDLKTAIRKNNYTHDEIIVRIVYCSRNAIEPQIKSSVPNPIYLDYPELRYFKNLTDCIKKTARHELFKFLEISPNELGTGGKLGPSTQVDNYNGSLLPESNSNFPKGFKVVSFYVDPDALLRRAYVLRKDGWRDSHNLYQRMISKTKIESIRAYLKKDQRVFVNNIIATLPSDTKILNSKLDTVDPANFTKTQPVKVQIPDRSNSVGLIDGQHRTFSYFEAVKDDPEIAKLRVKQNLLITGIVYPENLKDAQKEKFEAKLFLEINSTQTNAKSNLKQAIGLLLEPFSPESIATRVIGELDKRSGPLYGWIERYWFDKNKLKTTSIVSYGLRPLVKPSGNDSLFSLWKNPGKDLMVETENPDLLDGYVAFCVSEINKLLIAVRMILPSVLWTTDKNVPGRFLTTTNINALFICLRLLIENGKTSDTARYKAKLSGFEKFDFKGYHSSQYNRMAETIYGKFFT